MYFAFHGLTQQQTALKIAAIANAGDNNIAKFQQLFIELGYRL